MIKIKDLNDVIFHKFKEDEDFKGLKQYQILGLGFEKFFCELFNCKLFDEGFYAVLNRMVKSPPKTKCEVVKIGHVYKTDVSYKTNSRHKICFSLKNYSRANLHKVKFFNNYNLHGLKEMLLDSGILWNVPRNLQEDYVYHLFSGKDQAKTKLFLKDYKHELLKYVFNGQAMENIRWIAIKVDNEIWLYNAKKLYDFLISSKDNFIHLEIIDGGFQKNENQKKQQTYHVCLNFKKIFNQHKPDYLQDFTGLVEDYKTYFKSFVD